ncbi:hypothetical protein Dimus_028576 [Dionaea muscipula]
MNLMYMDHLMARRLVNLPRVMMRHMSYVISMKDHELPYGDWLTMVFEEFGSGENRRRDDDMDNPEEEAEKEDEGNKDGFDWEAVIDEAAVEGESGSGEKFYDAEDKDQSSPEAVEEIRRRFHEFDSARRTRHFGVDPSCPVGGIPESCDDQVQSEFERKRANRFLAVLEKAKAENARLLALLH